MSERSEAKKLNRDLLHAEQSGWPPMLIDAMRMAGAYSMRADGREFVFAGAKWIGDSDWVRLTGADGSGIVVDVKVEDISIITWRE